MVRWWMVSGAHSLRVPACGSPWYSAVLRDGVRALVLGSGKEGALLLGGTDAVLPVCLGDWVSSFPTLGVGVESWSCRDIDKNIFK